MVASTAPEAWDPMEKHCTISTSKALVGEAVQQAVRRGGGGMPSCNGHGSFTVFFSVYRVCC